MVYYIILIVIFIGFFSWRFASYHFIIPWPFWLSWMLENPYMLIVSNSKEIIQRLNLKPGMKFADLGCGAGRITTPAAIEVGNHGLVDAFDLQEGMLKKAKSRSNKRGLKNIHYIKTEIKPGILKSNYYDRAALVTVLGEIPKRKDALKEIFQSLKPGGILSVTEVIPDPCYITQKSLKEICNKVGFHHSQTWKSPLAYTMNFQKP